MNDKRKTKAQLISELEEMRRRVAVLETLEIKHKKTEETLRNSEKKYKAIFDHANEGIISVDPETRRLFDPNKRMIEMLGYDSAEEVEKLTVPDIHPEQDLPFILKEFDKHAKRESSHSEDIPVKRKDSSIFHAAISSFAITTNHKTYLSSIFRDITERKRIEDTLKESEQQYRSLIGSLQEGIWVIDEHGNTAYVNSPLADMFGYTPEEMLGKHLFSFMDKQQIKIAIGLLKRRQKEIKEQHEFEFIKKDGERIHVLIETSPLFKAKGIYTGAIAGVMNITERKNAEEALRESEERYRALIETAGQSGQGIIITQNTEDREVAIVFANDEYCRITGYSKEELLNMTAWDLVPSNGIPELQERSRRRRAGENIPRHYEGRLLCKDGALVPVESFIGPMTYRGKAATVSYIWNIAERKKMEEEIRSQTNFLEAIIEQTPSPLWISDDKGTVIKMNQAIRDLLQITDEEIIGKYNVLNDTQVAEQGFMPLVKSVFEAGKIVAFTLHYHTEKERQVELGKTTHKILDIAISPVKNAQGRITNLICQEIDITERKMMEEGIRKLAMIVESSEDAIISNDIEGIITTWNRGAEAVYGFTASEMLGKPISVLAGPGRENEIPALLKRVGRSEPIKRYETLHRRKDGRDINVSITISPIRDAGGAIAGASTIARDVTEHRKAEEALRESEERSRALVETAGQANEGIIIVQDTEDREGAIIFANDTYCRISGYSKEEMLNMTVWDLATPRVIPELQERYRRRQAGEDIPRHYEGKLVRKDGTLVPIENFAGTMTYHGKKATVTYTRDITERKKTEQMLRAAEERFRKAFRASPDAITISRMMDGLLIEANDMWEKILGYSRAESVGTSTVALGIWPDPAIRQECVKQLQKTGSLRNFETALRRKKGELCQVSLSSERIEIEGELCLLTIIRDITERKQAEEALRDSEQKYRDLFNTAEVALFRSRIADGKIIECNDLLAKLFGYDSREQCRAEHVTREHYVDPEARHRILAQLLEHGAASNFEALVTRRDGSPFWISYSAHIYPDKGYIEGAIVDITERKKAEEALKRSERLLKEAQKLGRIGNWEYDIEKQTVVWSDETYVLYERDMELGPPSPEEGIGYYAPAQATILSYYADKAIATGQTLSYDLEPTLPSGKKAYYHSIMQPISDERGRIVKISGTVQDITERKKAEEALRSSEERLRLTFESVDDGIIVTDSNFKMVRINEAAVLMSGYNSKSEIIGKNALEFIPEREHTQFEENSRFLLNLGYLNDIEFTLLRKDGNEFPAELSAAILKDALGNPDGFVAIVKDITERKKLGEQLMLADRLASIGELASGIAHELNNPLTSIIGLSELVLRRDLPGDIKEDLDLVHSEAQRAANVVRGMLSFARRHPPEKQLLDVNEVIVETLKLHDYEHRTSNIEVVRHFAPDIPQIAADYHQLQQVFFNIIINADYFIAQAHNKGTLTITTEKAGGVVRVSFTDDGPGIPNEHIGHIFDPFYTTKDVGRGTGLGLSICHGIVTAHGGRIYAESKFGQGATFVVELPLKQNVE